MKNFSEKPYYDSSCISDSVHKHTQNYTPYIPAPKSAGLADLQQATSDVLLHGSRWGFGGSNLNVKRHKLDDNTWQLTVTNPRTKKTILQATGHGDTLFANEDNLARMAEVLLQQGLSVRTHFDD